jgi:hypothetical protein
MERRLRLHRSVDRSVIESQKSKGAELAQMRTFTRLSLIAGVAVLAQAAFATINYNVLDATVAYNNGDSNALNVAQNGNAITFTSVPPIGVGDGFWSGNGHAAATVTIIYTVQSDKALTGLDLIFTGSVLNKAAVSYSELVENWNPNSGSGSIIADTSGVYKGAGVGGVDGGFNNETFLDFQGGFFSYKVKKTFTLTDLDSNPAESVASLGLVEQNAVPEPASMGALAMGALGLLARRRRK